MVTPNFRHCLHCQHPPVPPWAHATEWVTEWGQFSTLFSTLTGSLFLADQHLADKKLNVAKTRFQARGAQFTYKVGDYRTLQIDHNFDLVVSSLSIHHLTDAEKQHLFRQIFKMLRKSGLFINIDQIRGETAYLRDLYWNNWLTHVHENKLSEELIQESIARRTKYDRDTSLSDQLQWLKDAGFVNVDCVSK